MTKQPELQWYSLDRILKEEADYNIIFGERSTGKTYAIKKRIIERAIKYNEDGAVIRRYDVDMKGRRGASLFNDIIQNGILQELNSEWTDIWYWGQAWYFCKYDDKHNRIKANEPFCYMFTLASVEHDKSTSYPKVATILFDEFITRQLYLLNEFVLFQNQLSTIIRHRGNVKIFMCGNSVNKYGCIYFKEMGLRHVNEMKEGEIALYTQGKRKIAVEYTGSVSKEGKESDKYFTFDNPHLKMITEGSWETAMYPHLIYKYKRKDILFIFFIIFEEQIMQCEIVQLDELIFMYVHRKTTELKDTDNDLIYSTEYTAKPNYKRRITQVNDEISRKILWFFNNDRVFYQDNDLGELMRSYFQWCRTEKLF